MRPIFAILLGKTIFTLTRFFRIGGGSAAPGLFALRIDPELVEGLIRYIPQNVIITGTNGKTTTARMLSHFAQAHNLKVIRNQTGSNLERGVASTLIQNFPKNFDLGIWELDEAAFNSIAPKINPQVVVFLNVFRDQLDRYGEVDSVVKRWCQTLTSLSKTTQVLVNGDDANTAKLAKCFAGKVLKFGVKDYKIIGESIERKKEKEKLDFEAKNVKLKGLAGSEFQIANLKFKINLPGIYHIYDAVAAIACAKILNLAVKNLREFSPAFGRVEKLPFGYIFLIKNPAGATQVFATIAPQLKKNDRLLLALNDNLADGTDVSWIWDGEFEKLNIKNQKSKIIASGTRAYDLANRLKYAGFDTNSMIIEPNLEQAFKMAKKDLKGRLFILPTYTAMLQLQSVLAKSGIKKHYWEEE